MDNTALVEYVHDTLEERARSYLNMDADHQGYMVMTICASLEVDGWLEAWRNIPQGKKRELIMGIWKKIRRR